MNLCRRSQNFGGIRASLGQTAWVLVGGPKNFGNAGLLPHGCGWSVETCPSPRADFDHFWSNGMCTYFARKIWPLAFHLFKVNGSNMDWLASYDFLLVIRGNYGKVCLISFRKFNGDFGWKCKFFPLILNTQLKGFSWNFVMAVGLKKLRLMPLPDGEKVWQCMQLFRHSTKTWQTEIKMIKQHMLMHNKTGSLPSVLWHCWFDDRKDIWPVQ